VALYNAALTPAQIASHFAIASTGCAPRTSPYSQAISSTPGVVSYWRLGEATGSTACDSAGSNPGTYQSGTMLGQPGALVNDPDAAVHLNGTSGWVSVPAANSLNVGDRFTIEAWVRRERT